MALVDIVSFSFRDADPKPKSMPLFFTAGSDLADLQAAVDAIATAYNAAGGAVIAGATLTRQLTLPSGLRATPVSGTEVQRGALLRYSAENTLYKHGIFVPGWNYAGFSGDALNYTGVYATFADMLDDQFGASQSTDENGNSLIALVSGKKAFRK